MFFQLKKYSISNYTKQYMPNMSKKYPVLENDSKAGHFFYKIFSKSLIDTTSANLLFQIL